MPRSAASVSSAAVAASSKSGAPPAAAVRSAGEPAASVTASTSGAELLGCDTGQLVGEVARRAVAGAGTGDRGEGGPFGGARLRPGRPEAAGVEGAAAGDADERGRLPDDAVEALVLRAAVDAGQRSEETERVGVPRVVEDVVDGADLGLPPGVHHHDAVGHSRDDAQVVGDEKDRRVRAVLDALEDIEDLGLDGDVEGGGGLVGDEDLGFVGDRHGDHRPLAHPAGVLVRVLVGPRCRVGDADHVQQ